MPVFMLCAPFSLVTLPLMVERRVEAEEAEALLVSERRDGAADAAGEAGLRQQVQRVRVREELRKPGQRPGSLVRRPARRRSNGVVY